MKAVKGITVVTVTHKERVGEYFVSLSGTLEKQLHFKAGFRSCLSVTTQPTPPLSFLFSSAVGDS